VEVKEAEVAFPNIPLPRSSDNNVCITRELSAAHSIFLPELGYQDAKLCESR
jgi:hypothetical protein